jgi:hypothetical protein
LATVHVQDPWLNKDLPESWVQLWDLKTLKPTRKLKGDGKLRGDTGVRFSPDGGSVAAIFAPTFDERKVFTGVIEWDAASGIRAAPVLGRTGSGPGRQRHVPRLHPGRKMAGRRS